MPVCIICGDPFEETYEGQEICDYCEDEMEPQVTIELDHIGD